MPLDLQVTDRIEAIQWFNKCGSKIDVNITTPFQRVSSWNAAKASYSEIKWDNIKLETSGNLSVLLLKNYPDKRGNWNALVKEVKEFLNLRVKNKLILVREQYLLNQTFVDVVMWDLLHAVMETIYLDCNPPIFYLNLLYIYELQHFPCGWKGKWPSGSLLIF